MEDPDVQEMLTALKRRAELRGRIKEIDLQIKKAELPIRKSNPRKPELRDEITLDMQEDRLQLEMELEHVESTIEYLNFYTGVWKYSQYNISRAI